MVIFRLVEPRHIPDPCDCLLWVLKFLDHCHKNNVNPYLDLKVSFIVDTIYSVGYVVIDVIDTLWWSPYYFP